MLTALARGAIAEALGTAPQAPVLAHAAWLDRPGASFVTLKKDGRLRGCIGTLEAYRPLAEDVRANAVHAALHDPRFPPLEARELPHVRIEVSLLTPPRPLPVDGEAELLRRLRPGIDGVILAYGARKATFLPQVWESLPDPRRFLAHLKMKAGLPPDFWHADLRVATYRVERFEET